MIPKDVLIVGGGSSGWMTAALLAAKFPEIRITLVEASDIPVIGVGESTNLTMRYFLSVLGFDEREFMRACDSTYKRAIRFTNFNQVGGAFYHPFGQVEEGKESRDFLPNAQAAVVDFPSIEAGNLVSADCACSYQLDAGLLAEYLKQQCRLNETTTHVVDRVLSIELDVTGNISAVNTAKHGSLKAELYIDCTGFRSCLLAETLKEPFESCSHLLLNDRAVAVRAPYNDKTKELVTHTNCTALSAGWAWNIPLWSRIGLGYVYSSLYLTNDQAESELRRFWGTDRSEELDFRHIKISTGRHLRAWVGNCVAIGISYGFLEPLESTGLSLTQIAIWDLTRSLESTLPWHLEREIYNARQGELFDSTRDFILAHYVLTQREDTPYWRTVRNDIPLPDSLLHTLTDARSMSYGSIERSAHRFYFKGNWNIILSGMNYFGAEADSDSDSTMPAGEIHATYLQKHIYSDAAVSAMPVDIFHDENHPIWYPSW